MRNTIGSLNLVVFSRPFIRLARAYKLDFESCTVDDVNRFMDTIAVKSRPYQVDLLIFLKRILRYLGRDEVAKAVVVPKKEDRFRKVKEKLLEPSDVKTLLEKVEDPQDRLLIHVLYETGARLGELYNMKIKDVAFDEFGGILWLTGKSGTRRRRIYTSVPEIRRHLNDHPEKDNPETRFFRYGHIKSVQRRIRKLGRRILKKRLHAHMLRHTKATEDSRYFTDRELMSQYGWTKPDMVGVYSHISMKDVEDKDLVLHGKKRREDVMKPLVQVRRCRHCGEENAPISMYCVKCGKNLATIEDVLDMKEFDRLLIERLKDLTRKDKKAT